MFTVMAFVKPMLVVAAFGTIFALSTIIYSNFNKKN